jgi:putative endonuclease
LERNEKWHVYQKLANHPIIIFNKVFKNIKLMAEHNEKGKIAESMAKDWLIGKGYEFIASNYRYRHAEIDLICKYRGILVFVEVKFRSGTGYGFAEEFVDSDKKRLIIKAAQQFIFENNWMNDIRFDILAVYKDKNNNLNFKHFEDAFY